MLKHAILICVLVSPQICSAILRADHWTPSKSDGSLSFYVDVCQFQGKNDKTVLEVYYSVDLSQCSSSIPDTADVELELGVDVVLINASQDTLAVFEENQSISLSKGEDNNYSFVGLAPLSAVADEGVLSVAIAEKTSEKSGVLRQPIKVRVFDGQLSMSDLLLSSKIQRASQSSVFAKGGLIVLPNVQRGFSSQNGDKFYTYFEINNLSFTGDTSGYQIGYQIADADRTIVYESEKQTLTKSGANSARIEIIPLGSLESGLYELTLHLTDFATNQSCKSSQYFAFTTGSDPKQLLLPMTEADVKKYYDQIKYLASDSDKKLYHELSPRGKQQFLFEFWKSRDLSPETDENEFMLEHFRRLAFCEKEIAGGIDSDMARIYIKYGEPTERNRGFSRLEFTRPVEIWTYAVEGKIEFVFVDRVGDGRYTLVHSTQKEEIANPNWQELAK